MIADGTHGVLQLSRNAGVGLCAIICGRTFVTVSQYGKKEVIQVPNDKVTCRPTKTL